MAFPARRSAIDISPLTVLHLASLFIAGHCQDFTSDPRNTTAFEGGSARFTCSSPYATVNTCPDSYRLSWIHRQDEASPSMRVADCNEVYYPFNQRMITAGVERTQYCLNFPNVQPKDSGQYWCQLYFEPGSIHNRLSAKAWLTVNPLLPRFSPSCEVQPEEPSIGTEISLTCTLSERDPVSFLTWYKADSNNEQVAISKSRKTQPGQGYTIQQVLEPTDNMLEFTCTAGPHTTGPSCSLFPLQINPFVTVSPSFLTRYEGERAVFTCNLETVPPADVDEFRWMVYREDEWQVNISPEDNDYRFELTPQGQTLEIPKLTIEDFDESRVRCSAIVNGAQFQSVNDSFLTVLSSTATPPDDDTTQGSSAGAIIGGALAVVLSLGGMALLVIYWVKNKQKLKQPPLEGADNLIKMRGRKDGLNDYTNDTGNAPTYENILEDSRQSSHPLSTKASTDDPAEAAGVMYTLPGHTGSGRIRRYLVPTSANDKAADLTPVDEHDSASNQVASEQVIYAMPFGDDETPTTSRSEARGSHDPLESIGTAQATDGKDTDSARGMHYADLDLDTSSKTRASQQGGTTAVPETSADTVYAEIHNDP
ncbi:cell adhesion molecule 4-like [Acanthaster planci]|uniref:Cell adhesion molecule 4-like n=1 Tax=Acanthaster planci TaxID=133434 RepID=A0A8B7Y9L8_ACAPL|nr:cell adhesion molecule 4-like [Acanthaster planci]